MKISKSIPIPSSFASDIIFLEIFSGILRDVIIESIKGRAEIARMLSFCVSCSNIFFSGILFLGWGKSCIIKSAIFSPLLLKGVSFKIPSIKSEKSISPLFASAKRLAVRLLTLFFENPMSTKN